MRPCYLFTTFMTHFRKTKVCTEAQELENRFQPKRQSQKTVSGAPVLKTINEGKWYISLAMSAMRAGAKEAGYSCLAH